MLFRIGVLNIRELGDPQRILYDHRPLSILDPGSTHSKGSTNKVATKDASGSSLKERNNAFAEIDLYYNHESLNGPFHTSYALVLVFARP